MNYQTWLDYETRVAALASRQARASLRWTVLAARGPRGDASAFDLKSLVRAGSYPDQRVTHDSCVEQCGSVSFFVRRDLRSLSSLH